MNFDYFAAIANNAIPNATNTLTSTVSYYRQIIKNNKGAANEERKKWAKSNTNKTIDNTFWSLFDNPFNDPQNNLKILPSYSFLIQFTFTLAEPYISRDEQKFYIIDNPIRKDKVSGQPYVAATAWKGSLRAALHKIGNTSKNEQIQRLLGNDRDLQSQAEANAGRLYFYPTFFKQKSLEIINPHDRKRRVGKNPILFESVPTGEKGIFTLLYVPLAPQYIITDLELVAQGLQAMFCIYGFGAKTSSGFGLVKAEVENSLLILNTTKIKGQGAEDNSNASSKRQELPRYLEAPNRLNPEYRNPEGGFRERLEVELKKMSKSDKQLYDKAKSWWEREGKNLTETVDLLINEPPTVAKSEELPKWTFNSFEALITQVSAIKQALLQEGDIQ